MKISHPCLKGPRTSKSLPHLKMKGNVNEVATSIVVVMNECLWEVNVYVIGVGNLVLRLFLVICGGILV